MDRDALLRSAQALLNAVRIADGRWALVLEITEGRAETRIELKIPRGTQTARLKYDKVTLGVVGLPPHHWELHATPVSGAVYEDNGKAFGDGTTAADSINTFRSSIGLPPFIWP